MTDIQAPLTPVYAALFPLSVSLSLGSAFFCFSYLTIS